MSTEALSQPEVPYLDWGPSSRLPAPYCDWIDPTQALPEELEFLPHLPLLWFSSLLGFLFGGGLLVGIVALLWPYFKGNQQNWKIDDLLFLLVFVSALGYVVGAVARKYRIHRLWRAGHWRQGVFLAEQALLIHCDTQRCFLLPRHLIQSIDANKERSDGNSFSGIEVHYHNGDQEASVSDGLYALAPLQRWWAQASEKSP